MMDANILVAHATIDPACGCWQSRPSLSGGIRSGRSLGPTKRAERSSGMRASSTATLWTYPAPEFDCTASTLPSPPKPARLPNRFTAAASGQPRLWLISFVGRRCDVIRLAWIGIDGRSVAARSKAPARTSSPGWSGKAMPSPIPGTPMPTSMMNLSLAYQGAAYGPARSSGRGITAMKPGTGDERRRATGGAD